MVVEVDLFGLSSWPRVYSWNGSHLTLNLWLDGVEGERGVGLGSEGVGSFALTERHGERSWSLLLNGRGLELLLHGFI